MPRPHVTDQALIRYLERHLGIDVAKHRRRIARAVEKGVEHEADGVIVDGMRFKLKGNAVTTCWEANTPDIRTGCAKGKRGFVDGAE